MKKIGFTTTIPVEAVFAAGCTPVDLNNVFITSKDPAALVTQAEYAGYPHNACGWIKGIYSTVKQSGIDTIVAVVEGDCSQTHAMVETLQTHDIRIIPFAYPHGRDRSLLRAQIDRLISALGADWEKTIAWYRRLDEIRSKVWQLDEFTWQKGSVSSWENHYYQVCCSDFNSDPDAFAAEVDERLAATESAPESDSRLRLGYIGVPPIYTDLYQFLEGLGTRVVYNEVQRQFSLPLQAEDMVERYALYTYPYDIFGRIDDIKREVRRRKIAGLIHYTQSFCFRQIQDMVIRKNLEVPILTIEGDSPVPLDARTKVRIESFVEMLN